MAIPKFMSKPQFLRMVTSQVVYPSNVQLRDVKHFQDNFVRCYFLVEFPVSKSHIELTLTVSPEEHTTESAMRLINEKLKQCAGIEYEEVRGLIDKAEEQAARLRKEQPPMLDPLVRTC